MRTLLADCFLDKKEHSIERPLFLIYDLNVLFSEDGMNLVHNLWGEFYSSSNLDDFLVGFNERENCVPTVIKGQ